MKSHFALCIGALIFTVACSTTKTVTKVEDADTSRTYALEKYFGRKEKKLAITKFENLTRFGQRRLGDQISNVLSTELAKTERFILLERAAVDQILEQVKLSQSGLTEGELEQIQLLDADFIITGAVTHYAVSTTGTSNVLTQSKTQKAEVAADVRIINVRTGEVILSENGKGLAEKKFSKVLGMGESGGYDESLEMDAFRAAVVKVTENIISSLDQRPWTCDVVKIDSAKLYIDAGKKSNLKSGDVMEIYQKGELIKDLSGRILGYEETMLDEAIVIDFIGDDGAILSVASEKRFQMPLICKLAKSENQ